MNKADLKRNLEAELLKIERQNRSWSTGETRYDRMIEDVLRYVDNSISKEVIENKIEKYKKMSDDFYSRFIESGRLNTEIRDAGFSCDRKIEALQEVMEGK